MEHGQDGSVVKAEVDAVTEAKLHETFDALPSLIEVLKDVLAASSSHEATRVGDVSETAVKVRDKYEEMLRLLAALPGTDTSLEEQEKAIVDAKQELQRISELSEFYSNTLYRGTDEPREQADDAFSREKL